MKKKVAIIGAGITGLTAAWELKRRDIEVVLFEKSYRAGGVIESELCEEKYLIEYGPNTLNLSDKRVIEFLNSLNLQNDLIEACDGKIKRYVVKEGKLVEMPLGMWSFLWSGLFTFETKIRIFKEFFIGKKKDNKEESVCSFFRRHFGDEILDYVVDPFARGIHAGNLDELSVKYAFPKIFEKEKAYGSVIKGFLFGRKDKNKTKRKIVGFENGMQVLTDRIVESLEESLKLGIEIMHIERVWNKWRLQWDEDDAMFEDEFTDLILAIPAYELSKLPFSFESLEKSLEKIGKIEYAPMWMHFVAYKKEDVTRDVKGFGFLVPSKEKMSILGSFFNSSMFNQRCPEDEVLFTAFVGGAENQEVIEMDMEEVGRGVRKDLRQLLGINGQPVFEKVKVWEKAIPQMNIGYGSFLEIIEDLEREFEGLYIAGNFREGPGLPDCIKSGISLGEKIEKKNV